MTFTAAGFVGLLIGLSVGLVLGVVLGVFFVCATDEKGSIK